MAFLVICFGITILQMSKVDPKHLSKLDRKSTILLQAARNNTESLDEKGPVGMEDPGMDTLRGSFGTVGSIIRARSARRMSMSRPSTTSLRSRPSGPVPPQYDAERGSWASDDRQSPITDRLDGMKRHQLWDAPVPTSASLEQLPSPSLSTNQLVNKRPTIKFDTQDVIHQYHPPGSGDGTAIHEHRDVLRGTPPAGDGMPYPPARTQSSPDANVEATGSSTTDGSMRQTLSMPSLFDDETKGVRSAPPTVNTRFSRNMTGRADSRDIFDNSPSSATLMSFPSGSDSAGNRPWEADEDERGRPKRIQRYPKGAGDIDREESVSLWQQHSTDEENDYDGLPRGNGIRLVKPSSGSRF